jgi:hypothetical protein
VEQTLRYLRTRLGVDITGLQFSVYKLGSETLIETNLVVGREPPAAAAEKSRGAREPESDESILARAKTEFVRKAVLAIEEWVSQAGLPNLTVRHGTTSDHYLRIGNENHVYYYYASRWIYAFLYRAMSSEIEKLQTMLSKPEEVRQASGGAVRFHLATDADLEVLKQIVLARVEAAASS